MERPTLARILRERRGFPPIRSGSRGSTLVGIFVGPVVLAVAYTLVDVDSVVGPEVLAGLSAIPGVLMVRYLPDDAR